VAAVDAHIVRALAAIAADFLAHIAPVDHAAILVGAQLALDIASAAAPFNQHVVAAGSRIAANRTLGATVAIFLAVAALTADDLAAGKAHIVGAIRAVNAEACRFAVANLHAVVAVANANALANAAAVDLHAVATVLHVALDGAHVAASETVAAVHLRAIQTTDFDPPVAALANANAVVAFVACDAQIPIRTGATNVARHHGPIFQVLKQQAPPRRAHFQKPFHHTPPVTVRRIGEEKPVASSQFRPAAQANRIARSRYRCASSLFRSGGRLMRAARKKYTQPEGVI
jgi:hypothetical protein